MTTQEVKRKLTAIRSADVKGYNRLMGDEEWTLRTLNARESTNLDNIFRIFSLHLHESSEDCVPVTGWLFAYCPQPQLRL